MLEEGTRDAALALTSRWKKQIVRAHVLEGGLAELATMVEASGADHIVLAALSSVCLMEAGALRGLVSATTDQLVKISVGRTPIDMYCAPRPRMTRLLAAAAERNGGRRGLRDGLFEGVLHGAIDLIEDLPGEILFYNDLMDYYTNNIWVVSHCEDARFHTAVARLPELADKGAESHIGEKGSIRNSWLASGVEVEGRVEDSIIFPNVVVRRHALVSHSVVLNGNRIGSGTEIHNALILPYASDAPRTGPNIGDNCAIGAKTSSMKNADFPTHIRDGIAVIGANVDIPNGFQAEAASYVAQGVSPSTLRKLKVLRRGTSILGDPAPAAPGRRNGSRGIGMNEFQTAIDFLTRTERFVITAHETPDGDAIGSECAMLRALRSQGKKAIILNADPTPRKFAYLDSDKIVGVLEREEQLPADIAQWSLLMLDTNDVNNIGQIAKLVLPRVARSFHHRSPRAGRGYLNGEFHPEERLLDVGNHLPHPRRHGRRDRLRDCTCALHGHRL